MKPLEPRPPCADGKPAPAHRPKALERPPEPAHEDDDKSVAGEEDPGSATDVLRRGIAADPR